jgi:glycosidase
MRKLATIILTLLLAAALTVGAGAQDTSGESWQDGDVFYQIFVRSFYDSDGDGTGDFNGIIEKLDYLNDGDPQTTDDLGVTGIWLMPIMKSPSYHGYDTTDYYAVNSWYGTPTDFKRLLDAAHERGMKVIIDLMINHTAKSHPWFVSSRLRASEKREWYVWRDENPGFRGPSGQPVWHADGRRFYYGVFGDGMPDLNLENPAVTAQLYDIARYWLVDMGVDGFRLDGSKHLIEIDDIQENTVPTRQWLAEFKTYVKSIRPDALLIGEVWSPTNVVAQYVPDQVDLAFEFDLAAAMMRSGTFGTANFAADHLETVTDSFPAGRYATFLANHDQNRVVSQMRGDYEGARRAASLLLTMPGVPFVYYGEEIGMTGQKPDEMIRTPMQWDASESAGFTPGVPWQAVNADYADGINVDAQSADPESLLNHYRGLINLRVRTPALQHGDYQPVESSHRRVHAFTRSTADQTVLVLINMADQPVSDYTLAQPTGQAGIQATLLYGSGDVAAPVVNTDGGFADYTPLTELAPLSVTVIELAP